MAKRINVVELKAAAHGRWLEILSALARDLRPALESKTIGKHVSCPVHKGKGQDGLRAYKNVGDTGGTVCNTCGNHPDGVQTLMWVNDWTFRKVLEEVDNYLGGLAYAHSGRFGRGAPRVASRLQRPRRGRCRCGTVCLRQRARAAALYGGRGFSGGAVGVEKCRNCEAAPFSQRFTKHLCGPQSC